MPAFVSSGPLTVTGEIVDSKCYLGVMNPGNGKVHRDCAARCISGGVPVALVTNDIRHRGTVYYLQSPTRGESPTDVFANAGELTTVSDEGLTIGEQQFLILP